MLLATLQRLLLILLLDILVSQGMLAKTVIFIIMQVEQNIRSILTIVQAAPRFIFQDGLLVLEYIQEKFYLGLLQEQEACLMLV